MMPALFFVLITTTAISALGSIDFRHSYLKISAPPADVATSTEALQLSLCQWSHKKRKRAKAPERCRPLSAGAPTCFILHRFGKPTRTEITPDRKHIWTTGPAFPNRSGNSRKAYLRELLMALTKDTRQDIMEQNSFLRIGFSLRKDKNQGVVAVHYDAAGNNPSVLSRDYFEIAPRNFPDLVKRTFVEPTLWGMPGLKTFKFQPDLSCQ